MSGALDTKARLTAEKLLQKFGKVANYQSISNTGYNPATGEASDFVIEIDITCYIDKPKSGDIYAGLISINDAIILVSAKELSVTPKIDDLIVFSDKTYSVKFDMPVYSGELIALHQLVCQIR